MSGTSAAVRTRSLHKVYGDHTALAGVDLEVATGSVYGLVGPNGSGKTTLFSIITGLRHASGGQVHVRADRGRVALVPDTPEFDGWLTAWECVDLARQLSAPDLPDRRVDEALARTGLADAAQRRVGGFSRGMKQRLGLATAVVSDPELLILDEPASALDPAGRREVLDLVAGFRGHVTVLFSSHILGDVQEICDTVGILRAGELLFEGTISTLLQGRAAPAYAIRLRSPLDPVVGRLRAADWVASVEVRASDLLSVGVSSVEHAERQLAGLLAAAEARVVSIVPEQADLESVFLELTR